MASMEEREFTLFLDVRVEGYGSEMHEETIAQEVERLLRVRMGDRISVSLVRDSDKVDTAESAFVKCETCVRGMPSNEDGRVVYRCVDCGAAMNVPDPRPSGGTLGERIRRVLAS